MSRVRGHCFYTISREALGLSWPAHMLLPLHAYALPSLAMALAMCSVLHGLGASWLSDILHLPAVLYHLLCEGVCCIDGKRCLRYAGCIDVHAMTTSLTLSNLNYCLCIMCSAIKASNLVSR